MNTKLLMIISALVMGITGICLSFLSEEIAAYLGSGSAPLYIILLQIMGGLYFAFAMLNWMAKANLIGGIYSRPVAIANVTHFMIGALALLKAAPSQGNLYFWILTVIYTLLAVAFGYVLFTHPVKS